MNRARFAAVSPVAFLAGALLVHCSSSSSTGVAGGSSSTAASSRTVASGASTSATSTAHSSGASTASTGTGTIVFMNSATGKPSSSVAHSTANSTGTSSTTMSGCPGGPDGGFACTPGKLSCGTATCDTPSQECCYGTGSGSSETCVTSGGTCAGNVQECAEKSDCPDGEICCLKVTDTSGDFTITCQAGTTCPAGGLANAQICTTNAECSTGKCAVYNCMGQLTEACQNPSAFGCTAQ
jgi:hypothetical protein